MARLYWIQRRNRNIRLLRSDAEHSAAVAEIEELLDAEAGTEEADRVGVLALLVEEYEQRHFAPAED